MPYTAPGVRGYACTLFIAIALLSVDASAAWWGAGYPRPVALDRVSSYEIVIAGSGDEADIYYPDVRSARGLSDLYPVVLLMQGANVNKEYYGLLAAGVARQGFVVVVPNQRSSVFGGAFLYAEMQTLHEVLAQMRTEDTSPDSPVFGIVDSNRLAVMGHSFGGAATMFAVAERCSFPFCDATAGFVRPPELEAVVLVSSNSGAFDFDTSGIPVAIVGGSLEIGRERQLATYATLEPPKAFITVEGATHYGMCDADVPSGARAKEGEPDQSVPNAVTASRYARWAGSFLRAHMYNDKRAGWRIYRPAESPGVSVVSRLR